MRVISAPKSVPTERSVLTTSMEIDLEAPLLSALPIFLIITRLSTVLSSSKSKISSGSKCCFSSFDCCESIPVRSIFISSAHFFVQSRSVRPISSSTERIPSLAIYSRSSCAMKCMKFTIYSGLPRKRLRSSGFCVAIPIGQVSRLQTLIITQPIVTSGAVANPNSSAPSRAATRTSRPVMSFPSVSKRTLERRPFSMSV